MEKVELTFYIVLGYGVLLFSVTALIVLAALRKRGKALLQLKEQEIESHKELIAATLSAHEEERQHIGMELHDDLGQNLTAIWLNMQDLSSDVQNMKMEQTLTAIEDSIQKCSHLSKMLYPAVLKKVGLKEGILQLAHDMGNGNKVKAEMDLDDLGLEPDADLHIYRIFQELINNSMKYADPSKIKLGLKKQADNVLLMYEDDGVGADLKTVKHGLGLNNIKLRAERLGGEAELVSSPGDGFKVKIEIPYGK